MHDAPVLGMYTKARIARHPIHPMLIAFPVALYTSTVIALIVHAVTRDPFWYRAAMYTNVTGVIMAVVAAVPGVVDLANLPAYSQARATGLRHAGFNVLALILFSASGAVIYSNWTRHHVLADGTPIILALLGLLSTMSAGWLGWTLVQTHHVGVKPTEHVADRQTEEIEDLDELMVTPPAPPPPMMRPTEPSGPVWRH